LADASEASDVTATRDLVARLIASIRRGIGIMKIARAVMEKVASLVVALGR
jgi:hypothetical protein